MFKVHIYSVIFIGVLSLIIYTPCKADQAAELPIHLIWKQAKQTSSSLKKSLKQSVNSLQKKRNSRSFWQQLAAYQTLKELMYHYPFLNENSSTRIAESIFPVAA